MVRSSEAQLQVGEKLYKITLRWETNTQLTVWQQCSRSGGWDKKLKKCIILVCVLAANSLRPAIVPSVATWKKLKKIQKNSKRQFQPIY